MWKKILLIIAAAVLLVAVVSAAFIYIMMKPAYSPGSLSSRDDLEEFTTPPPQTGDGAAGSGFFQVDEETRLRYFTEGSGRPVIVIHGGPGIPTLKPWTGLDGIDGYRFIYYQQRGCGYSTRPFDRFESSNYYTNMTSLIGKLGMEQQLADIERIRKILKVQKLILIGHSYGGYLAALYASEFPDRVEKMVLVSPAGVLKLPADNKGMNVIRDYLSSDRKKEFDDWLKDYFDYGKIFEKDEKELARLNSKYFEFYIETSKRKGIEVPAGAVQEIEQTDIIGGWVVHAIYLSLGRNYDHRPALKKIKADTLIVYGQDEIYPVSINQEYKEWIPGSRLLMMKGAGHFSFDEKPDEFRRTVKDFLE